VADPEDRPEQAQDPVAAMMTVLIDIIGPGHPHSAERYMQAQGAVRKLGELGYHLTPATEHDATEIGGK
jgi:hypothetical protein